MMKYLKHPPISWSVVDLLTFAQGALFVRQSGFATGSAGRALRMIDGNPLELTLSTDGREPIEFIYKLPPTPPSTGSPSRTC